MGKFAVAVILVAAVLLLIKIGRRIFPRM